MLDVKGSELIAGDVVAGRYRIEGPLGSGGMATVYRATQIGLDREVALKILRPAIASQSRARSRFGREARVAARLRHANTVPIFDFGLDGDQMFLVMELLRGSTLAERLLEPLRLTLAESVGIACDVADLLVTTHRIPLVHRDLKPDNIFLEHTDSNGAALTGVRAVVVDFGLAFLADDETLGRFTTQGQLVGTPRYMSPEQAHRAGVGPPADIYALGCVLYEMVTTRPVFDGRGMDVVTRHMYMPPDPPSMRRPGESLPSALEDLILSMLQKEPGDRPVAEQIREGLKALAVT